MGSRRGVRQAAAFAGLIAVGPLAFLACENDSTPGAAGPVGTGPTPTLTAPNPTPAPTSSLDAGIPDGSGPEDPGATIPDKRTLKLANFAETTVNACIKSSVAGSEFVGPLFRATGIPTNNVSARALIDQIAGKGEVKIIAASDTCAGAALATIELLLSTQSSDAHLGVYFTNTAGAFVEHLKTSTGKESVLTQYPLSDPRYERDDGAGGVVNLRLVTGTPVLLDPGVNGKITLLGVADVERRIKTLAGGTLSVWATTFPTRNILLCDERAAAVDGLSNCSPALRAP